MVKKTKHLYIEGFKLLNLDFYFQNTSIIINFKILKYIKITFKVPKEYVLNI